MRLSFRTYVSKPHLQRRDTAETKQGPSQADKAHILEEVSRRDRKDKSRRVKITGIRILDFVIRSLVQRLQPSNLPPPSGCHEQQVT